MPEPPGLPKKKLITGSFFGRILTVVSGSVVAEWTKTWSSGEENKRVYVYFWKYE
jgi:hypothetical protein